MLFAYICIASNQQSKAMRIIYLFQELFAHLQDSAKSLYEPRELVKELGIHTYIENNIYDE